jgi:YHS domain-containing protein
MRRAAVLIVFAFAACRQAAPSASRSVHNEMRTIDSVDPRPIVHDPPPTLPDEAAAPKPKDAQAAQNMVPLTEQDEQVRAKLPFAPAIAMDPIDGSKISIRASTPMLEYKNKLYYFSSEENKRMFQSNPEQFTKGLFSHL